LSATDGESDDIDGELEQFALPIPVTTRHNDRYTVLPGAPFALVTGEIQYLSNPAADIRALCESVHFLHPKIVEELDEYFQKNGVIASFISVYLSSADGNKAVLNIHCDAPEVLRGDEDAQANFFHITAPFHVLLLGLLDQLSNIEKDDPDFLSKEITLKAADVEEAKPES
jgi:hypothetical protein